MRNSLLEGGFGGGESRDRCADQILLAQTGEKSGFGLGAVFSPHLPQNLGSQLGYALAGQRRGGDRGQPQMESGMGASAYIRLVLGYDGSPRADLVQHF